MKFEIGELVFKHTGDYQLAGEVRGVVITRAGKVRYVVEHEPGFLHIYSGNNLMMRITKQKPAEDGGLDMHDNECFRKAQERGDMTFTLVGRDRSSARVICEWIKENIETCPADKLREALERAIMIRDLSGRRDAD